MKSIGTPNRQFVFTDGGLVQECLLATLHTGCHHVLCIFFLSKISYKGRTPAPKASPILRVISIVSMTLKLRQDLRKA